MDGGSIEWVVTLPDAQEPCGLFKGLLAKARHAHQRGTVAECAATVPVRNDIAREAPIEPGYAREQGGRSGIYINPNGIDAIFDDGIKRSCQIPLI